MQLRLPLTLSLVALLGACDDPSVTLPGNDGGVYILLDAQAAAPTLPVFTESPPALTPYSVVTLRLDTANAERMIVWGAGNPQVVSGVTGDYCVDVPLPVEGTYTLEIRSQNSVGVLSDAVTATVTRSATASPPATARLCDGSDPAGCVSTGAEICDNFLDDECDGYRDGDDSDCLSCTDDLYEPNDDLSAPQVAVDTRLGPLQLCPSDLDYYAVRLGSLETLQAQLRFIHSVGNLDLTLFDADGNVLDSSNTETDDETVTYTNTGTSAEVVYVLVFGVDGAGYVDEDPNDGTADGYYLQLNLS